MTSPLPTLIAAAGATAIALPVVRAVLLQTGILDHASERSSHTIATPRGGGLGVFFGSATASMVALMTAQVSVSTPALAIGGAVSLLALIGFRDDVRSLRAGPRLAVQFAAGAAVALAVSSNTSTSVAVAAALAGAVFTVFVVNVVNFMDGINGITALTMSAWGITTLWVGSIQDLPVAVASGAIAVGTSLAFLPFNAPKASLFLGDVGSYLYGGLVASTSIAMLAQGASPILVMAPLIPYSADVLATLGRRARQGVRLGDAHREHFYQILTRPGGYAHFPVALTYGVAALACGASAVFAPLPLASMILMTVTGIIVIGPYVIRARQSPKLKR